MFTKPLKLLIHRLGSPKCVVARISGCPDFFDVKRNFVVTVRRTGTFLVYIYYSSMKTYQSLRDYFSFLAFAWSLNENYTCKPHEIMYIMKVSMCEQINSIIYIEPRCSDFIYTISSIIISYGPYGQ